MWTLWQHCPPPPHPPPPPGMSESTVNCKFVQTVEKSVIEGCREWVKDEEWMEGEWMDEWWGNEWRMERMNEWMEGMSEWMNEWMEGMSEWMNEGWTEWMNGWREWMNEWMKDGQNEWMNDIPTFFSTGVLGGCCVTVGGNNPLSWEPVDIRGFGVFMAAVTVAFPPGNNNCNDGHNRITSTSKWRIYIGELRQTSMDQRSI